MAWPLMAFHFTNTILNSDSNIYQWEIFPMRAGFSMMYLIGSMWEIKWRKACTDATCARPMLGRNTSSQWQCSWSYNWWTSYSGSESPSLFYRVHLASLTRNPWMPLALLDRELTDVPMFRWGFNRYGLILSKVAWHSYIHSIFVSFFKSLNRGLHMVVNYTI